MSERKNIFRIGRRSSDEDQLTEMLAFLWQERPEILERWVSAFDPSVVGPIEVRTQFMLASGKRPDIAIRWDDGAVVVESKLGAGFGFTQVESYIEYLGSVEGSRTLVLLTQRPEPLLASWHDHAAEHAVTLLSRRWQDVGDAIGTIGEKTLAGDFIELLIQEGLVKPPAFGHDDWRTWNSASRVLLRINSFIDELEPIINRLDPTLKRSGRGLTERWVYRVWRNPSIEVGFGMTASGGEGQGPDDDVPAVIAFVGRPGATLQEVTAAVETTPQDRNRWAYYPAISEARGLFWTWPCLSRPAHAVLTSSDFNEQVDQAGSFVVQAIDHFRSRGFLPD